MMWSGGEGAATWFGGGVVEIWRAEVPGCYGDDAVLSNDEQERIARLRRPADRDRFRTAWVLVRQVLAAHVDMQPEALTFDRTCRTCGRTGHGKPMLVGGGRWAFSLSHAGGHVMLAVSDVGPVGVDIEAECERVTHIAAMVQAPTEQADTNEELVRLWVRKEAVLKATGHGLALPMASFTVTPPSWPTDPSLTDRLALADLGAPRGYRAAVAVIPDWTRVRCVSIVESLIVV